MPNAKNLIPASALDPEERKELGRRGGVASGVSRRRKKSLREAVDHILALPVTDAKTKRLTGRMGIAEDDADYQAAIVAAMVREALKGETKAAKLLMDLADDNAEGAGRYAEDDPLTASLKEMMGQT